MQKNDSYKITHTTTVAETLKQLLATSDYSSLSVLVDENTKQYCLPIIHASLPSTATIIETKSGESNKNIESATSIWKQLTELEADRHSLLINLGGGLLSDLGGFSASCFMRGIDFVTIPTTLLSQVDASVGGKQAVNLLGLKNQIGLFRSARHVLIDPVFLKTLADEQILSGFAEMLKHGLIHDKAHFTQLQEIGISKPQLISDEVFGDLIQQSVSIKEQIVRADPYEKGIRKALNFGHTFGHAFESFFNSKGQNITHGHAVILGMICESFLSNKKTKFPLHDLLSLVAFFTTHYPLRKIHRQDYNTLIEWMTHDKKNKSKQINISTLEQIGKVKINQIINNGDIIEALDFYTQLS